MMVNYDQEIGKNIREVRTSQKLSQAKLAEKCDISSSTLSAYERSSKIPSLATIAKIARALNVSIERLYYGDDNNAFISQAPNEGRRIVNCFFYLWQKDIFYYYEDEMFPRTQQQYYNDKGEIKAISLYIQKFPIPIRRLINRLNEYRNKKDTYDDPDAGLEILLSSVANEINQEIERANEGK